MKAPRFAIPMAIAALVALAPNAASQSMPKQWVIIVDSTGSVSGVLNNWKTKMFNEMINPFINVLAATSDVPSFALVEHKDFPFPPFGDSTDFPYLLRVPMTPVPNQAVWNTLFQPQLNAIRAGGGADSPESQLPAICLALRGNGLDLNLDGDYNDPGEVSPLNNQIGSTWGQKIGIIHATKPDNPHDSNLEPGYPQPGIPNVQTPGWLERTACINLYSDVDYYLLIDGPLDAPGQLSTLAAQTGGLVLNPGPNLENLRNIVLDILVTSGGCPAAVMTRNSTPPNSATYGADEMIPGTTWNAQIFLGAGPSSPSHGIVLIGTAPASGLLVPYGTLLVDPGTIVYMSSLTPSVAGFARFQVPIPNVASACGTWFYSQGLRFGPSNLAFTNAVDSLVGFNPVGP